jgi:ATP-dependent DNA ligase
MPAVYVPGRRRTWLKLKCGIVEDVIIGWYTSAKPGFGSLLAVPL